MRRIVLGELLMICRPRLSRWLQAWVENRRTTTRPAWVAWRSLS
jgi:hypothetical protein